jgi:hypothetical protein
LVKNFERLNDERITPYFLQLAKTPVKSDSLDTLCKDDSSPFENVSEQNSHIHRYYKDLYRLPDLVNEPDRNFKIEDFLGECAEHPDVLNSKISENEKNILDRPLGIEELDLSIKNAKKIHPREEMALATVSLKKIGIFLGYRYINTQSHVLKKVN